MMDLRQLECFIAVAEEGSFTRAAERIHVAQSGVSAHIKALERDMGQQLFERRPREVRLTAAGEALLPHVRVALGALSAGRASIDALSGLMHGRLAIGTITSISPRSLDLAAILASFHRQYPGVDLSLVEDSATMLTHRIREGGLDVAFTSLTEETVDGLYVRELHRESTVAAVPRSDPLAANNMLCLAALSDRPLIVLSQGAGLRWQLDRGLRRAGIDTRIAFEASDPDVLVTLAGQGLGVALVPQSAVAHNDCVVGVRVSDLPDALLGIVWRAGGAASPAARVFVEHVTALLS